MRKRGLFGFGEVFSSTGWPLTGSSDALVPSQRNFQWLSRALVPVSETGQTILRNAQFRLAVSGLIWQRELCQETTSTDYSYGQYEGSVEIVTS